MAQQNIFQALGLYALMELRDLFQIPTSGTDQSALTNNTQQLGKIAPATTPSFMTQYQQQLSQLSPNNNPMKLDNNAMGVASRRSSAFKTGKTRQGTGQLARDMRINALNI